MPKYYRICLWLTIVECVVAFTIALAPWINLMPIWIALPAAAHLDRYAAIATSGYGFWGAMWAIPNAVMLRTTDEATRRLWARLAFVVYLLWWIFWWGQIWDGTWQWYVVAGYVPLRLFQLVANLLYGRRG